MLVLAFETVHTTRQQTLPGGCDLITMRAGAVTTLFFMALYVIEGLVSGLGARHHSVDDGPQNLRFRINCV